MKLHECSYGTIVETKPDCEKRVGMIVGITNNIQNSDFEEEKKNPKHAIPLVQWSNGETYAIHHENIQPYED